MCNHDSANVSPRMGGRFVKVVAVLSFIFLFPLLTGTAAGQIIEGGDIHWETEWATLAPAMGWDAPTFDSDEDGIPDSWSFALTEAVIANPAIPGHTAGLVDLFNANLAALQTQNPTLAAQIGHLSALVISRNGFNTINALSQISGLGWTPTALTSSLYQKDVILYDSADLDGDFIRNDLETGATDAASYIAVCTTSNLVLEGNIPWESQWTTFAVFIGAEPVTLDVDGEGIPDSWELALAEAVITDPGVVHHSAGLRETYNANLLALGEHRDFAGTYGYLAALFISMNVFEAADFMAQLGGQTYSPRPLTEALYSNEPWLYPDIDLDGDMMTNYDEPGATDAASYVAVCTTNGLVLEGDIPWESQWAVLGGLFGDPDTLDMAVGGDEDGVPDYWQLALAEAIITDPEMPHHTPELRALYNANLQALGEHPEFGAQYGYVIALFISMGDFDTADAIAQFGLSYPSQPLMESLYTDDPWLHANVDLDGDLRRNTEETGATDAASYIAVCTTSSVTPTDIPWEEEWVAFAMYLGQDPQTWDSGPDGVPDYWQLSLAEAIITNEGVVHHSPRQRELYDANLAVLVGECPDLAYVYGHLAALTISMGWFDAAEFFAMLVSSCTLTEPLYQEDLALRSNIDLDGDGFINVEEPGSTDAESYVAACITSAIPYPLGLPQTLLDSAFYSDGKMAVNGTLNNAGTTVAFFGISASWDVSLYLVDVGDPSSWRLVAPDFTGDWVSPLSWTPDDSAILHRDNRYDVEANQLETDAWLFGYSPRQPVMTYKSQNNWLIARLSLPQLPLSDYTGCVSTPYAAEFATDGDTEGWILSAPESVSGGVVSMTCSDEQVAILHDSLSVAMPSNPCVVIRMQVPSSTDFEVYLTSPYAGGSAYSTTFEANVPGQMNAYVIPLDEAWVWPDITTLYFMSQVPVSGTVQVDYVRICEAGSFPAGNTANLVALPILPNGREDSSRQPVALTCFKPQALDGSIDRPAVSANGKSLSFVDYKSNPMGSADLAEIYVVERVDEILAAPLIPGTNVSSLAPQTLADPRVVAIRAHETPDNFSYAPAFSQDGSLLIYTEDWNNTTNGEDLGSLFTCNFDLMITRSDGTGEDYRVNAPGNRAFLNMSRGGTRVVYTQWAQNSLSMRLYIATLDVQVQVEGTGQEGNDVYVTEPQVATDGSGTTLAIPGETTIDYPEGVTAEIRISTPLDPAEPVQLPPPEAGFPAAGIPVVREFGPQGTVFSQPIVVTITYTDAEIEGLDESNLRIFLYNAETEIFDLPVTTIVGRDLENNTITFTLTHFSTFGVGGIASMEIDADSDGIPNTEDTDDDGDGLDDDVDPMPLDSDNDGLNNDVDEDDDGDGIPDTVDPFLFDTDNDGEPNQTDLDDDGDGIPDDVEGWDDIDNDGIGNQLDTDSDGDGFDDVDEIEGGSDPYDAEDTPLHQVPLSALPGALTMLSIGAWWIRRARRCVQ